MAHVRSSAWGSPYTIYTGVQLENCNVYAFYPDWGEYEILFRNPKFKPTRGTFYRPQRKCTCKKRRLFQEDFRSIIVCDWNKKSHLCDIIPCEIWRDTNGSDHLHQYLINSPQNYQFIKRLSIYPLSGNCYKPKMVWYHMWYVIYVTKK